MWVCVRRVQKFIWLWFIMECLVSNYCDWDRYWLLYCVLQTERDWHNGSPDTLHCLRFLRHRCNWCSRVIDHTLGYQNWNLLSHPNATLATSKGQWRKFELHDTSATSNIKWWNFELLAETLVWYPIVGSLGLKHTVHCWYEDLITKFLAVCQHEERHLVCSNLLLKMEYLWPHFWQVIG